MIECVIAKGIEGDFQWMDITEPKPLELDQIATDFNLPHYAVKDCLEPDHLPKFEQIDENLNFIILRLFSPGAGDHKQTIQDYTSKIALFFGQDFLITIHRLPLHFMEEIKAKYIATKHVTSPIETIVKIVWYVLHTYEHQSRDLRMEIENFESRIFLKEVIPNLQEDLYYLKRKAAVCRNILYLSTDVVSKIHTTKKDRAALQDVKDLHTKTEVVYHQIGDDIVNLLNSYLSIAAQRNNDIVKILTIFSVFFMPLTFIAGIYGMNFEHMPELKQTWGYPASLLLMVLISVLIWFWFKRKNWL
jgi:magnesium transporter